MDRTSWIAVILCASGLVGWTFWQQKVTADFQKQHQAQIERQKAESAKKDQASPQTLEAAKSPDAAPVVEATPPKEVILTTDTVRFVLTNAQGGGIQRAELLKHTMELGGEALISLNAASTHPVGALSDGPGLFSSSAATIVSQNDQEVIFSSKTTDGIEVEKRFFLPVAPAGALRTMDPYLIRLEVTLRRPKDQAEPAVEPTRYLYSGAAAPLQSNETSLQSTFYWKEAKSGDMEHKMGTYFKGGWFSKAKTSDTFEAQALEWAGVESQFFSIIGKALVPVDTAVWASHFPVQIPGVKEEAKAKSNAIEVALGLPRLPLKAGDQQTHVYEFYMGPKEYQRLGKLDPTKAAGLWGEKDNRQLVMNYNSVPLFGWIFGWAIKPFAGWLLTTLVFLKGVLGKYGFAIIVTTIIIRTAIWPLYAKSARTMKRMSKLTPLMTEIREKYKDDPQKQNTEVMKLYGEYGVNPLGGCLPMFAQLPVFLAFYRMLSSAVELRHEGFLWVKDLSMPDTVWTIPGLDMPLNLLPLLMAGTTYVQMSLTPKTGDKTQQMVMMFMPAMFVFICYNFASALALYWTTSNLFSILQTWLTNRLPEPELKKRKVSARAGGGFFDRLQERAKQQQERARTLGDRGDRHTQSKTKKRKK